ncbi:MAG: sulfite exporter TauE/SafE family protein [Rhodocyclaceae bacterium]|nr:sulfite exporter TauE/SafE family protein [Rhodocyclaceae bacterium]
MNLYWLAYIALGAAAGFFAGLMGVGGGTVLVPVLAMIFAAQHFPPQHVLHLALGTSMAVIAFTSISSLRAHHGHGAVLWPVVRAITPGILAGTLIGSLAASHVPTRPLAIFFVMFVALVALQMMTPGKSSPGRDLPGWAGMAAVGGGIGLISALVAIGGGAMSVPFMVRCKVRVHQAIGTAAAIGFPIALSGTLGYVVTGLSQSPVLPEGSLGYVYLPALFWVAAVSVLFAPLGARTAHRLPVETLKRIFAAILVLLAAKMAASLV